MIQVPVLLPLPPGFVSRAISNLLWPFHRKTHPASQSADFAIKSIGSVLIRSYKTERDRHPHCDSEAKAMDRV